MKTHQLTIDAMLAAMCAVLGCLSLDFSAFKITFESLPVIFASLMYGAVDGMLVGGIGTLISQLILYGVSPTTPLWMLPFIAAAAAAGINARRYEFNNSDRQIILIVCLSECVIFLLNTLAIYVDARVFGYYFPGYVLGNMGIRLIVCVLKCVLFSAVTPALLKKLSRFTGNGHRHERS